MTSNTVCGNALTNFLSATRRSRVAVAALAGLAMLASSIQAADAAQATQVIDVDDPGRIAYQSSTTCDKGGTNCNFVFPAVPKGHRLVVQHVSGRLLFDSNASGVEVDLNGGANLALSSFLAPPSFQRIGLFDQPVLQYFDGGSVPDLTTVADAFFLTSEVTISGYLLDCTAAPCAQIVH